MTYLNQLYRVFILGTLFSLFSVSGYSTQYSWTGTTSTAWRTTTNWSPNGIPGSTDTVTITNHTNNPTLSQNETVGKFTLTSGTISLQSYTLTTNGAAKFDGGTITGTATKAVKPRGSRATFDGTAFDAEVDAVCGDVVLSGSVFNEAVWFEQTGSSTGNGAGGNTFNSTAFFKNGGTAYFLLASTIGNTFHDTTTFFGAGTQEIVACKATSYFYGPIILNSTTSAGVNFGASDGDTSYFTSTSAIKIGSSGFSAGTLNLIRFFQLDSTRQELTLSGTAVLNISYSIFLGSFTATAPSTVLKYTTFNDSLTLTKTGSTAALAAGGNVFNGVTLIKNHSSSQWRFANEVGDTFNNKVTFYTDSTGLLRPFYIETSFVNDDLIATGSKIEYAASTGTVVFGGAKNQHIQGTKAIDFYRVRIDKTAGTVAIDTTVNISDSLNLKFGNLVSTSSHVLILKSGSKASGNSVSFIDGPVKKIGNSAFTFPIGKAFAYAPAKITALSNATDAFTAEYFYDQQNHGTSCDTILGLFSKCSYWNIARTTGSSTPYISFGWDSLGCGVFDTTDLRVANWNGSTWKDKGDSTISGDSISGFIMCSSNSVTYGDFTLAYRHVANTSIIPTFYNATNYPTLNHEITPDLFGYNGSNTLDDGTTWYQMMTDGTPPALFGKHCSTLRIPAGTIANYFDWRSGWMIRENHLPNDWHYLERFLDKDPFPVTGSTLPNEVAEFKNNADLICAKPMHCLNMLTSSFNYQLASLYRAKELNLSTDYIELGNEYYLNNEQYKQQFISPVDYAQKASQWCADLKSNSWLVDCKVAVIGTTAPNGVPGRREMWLENLLKHIDPSAGVDAVVMHYYIGSGLGGSLLASNVQKMLSTPFTNWDDQLKPELNSISNYKISNNGNDDPEIWLTEYNLRDVGHHNLGTWAHGLFVAALTLQFLENPKVTKIVSHTMSGDLLFGNIFSSVDGYSNIDPSSMPRVPVGYSLACQKWEFTAVGAALDLIYQAAKNGTMAKKIDFGPVSSISGNVTYPCLYGWHFDSDDGEQAVILNLHKSETFDINPIDLFGGTAVNLEYEIISCSDVGSIIIGSPKTTATQYYLLNPGVQSCAACLNIELPPHAMLRIARRNTTVINIKAPITELCEGTTTTFEVTGGNGSCTIPSSSNLEYLGNGVYKVTAPSSSTSSLETFTASDGIYTASVQFEYKNKGSVSVSGTSSSFCPSSGPAITLTANLSASAGSTTSEFIWVPDSGITGGLITSDEIEVQPSRTTNYQVYVYDGECWLSSDLFEVSVPFSDLDLGPDLEVCNGSTINLQGTVESGGGFNFQWSQNLTALPGEVAALLVTSPPDDESTIYTLTLRDANSCTLSKDVNVRTKVCCDCDGDPNCRQISDDDETIDDILTRHISLNDFINAMDDLGETLILDGTKVVGIVGNDPHVLFIDGNVDIKRDFTFTNCNFHMGENAKFTINNNCNVSFTDCEFNTCGDKMWDGIFVDQKDGYIPPEIILSNCTFNGAANAVVLRSNAGFKIEQCTFDENFMDVGLENYQQSVPSTSYIRQNTFTGSNSSFLMPPYDSDYKFAAIYLNDIENITIGDASDAAYLNTFNNSSFGIYSWNSSMKCYNNSFYDINKRSGDTHAKRYWGSAIYSFSLRDFGDRNLLFGNGVTSGLNSIAKVNYGLYLVGEMNSSIQHNVFGANGGTPEDDQITTTCIKILGSFDKTINILDENKFYDYNAGIDIYNVTSGADIQIEENTFYEPLDEPTFAWNNTAIRLRNAIFSPLHYCSITDNIIGDQSENEGSRIGIFCSNVGNLRILSNEIYMNATATPTQNFRGIWVQNIPNSEISHNTILDEAFEANRALSVVGIFGENSMQTCYGDNDITNMGYSMLFRGNCNFTNLFINDFIDYDEGVRLDHADIGNQGATNDPKDNTWTVINSLTDLRVEGQTYTQGTPSFWYYKTGAQFLVNGGVVGVTPSLTGTSSQTSTDCTIIAELEDEEWETANERIRNQTWGSLVGDSADYDENYAESFTYNSKVSAYKFFKKHPALLEISDAADESFQNAFTEWQASNISKFDLVSEYFATLLFKNGYLELQEIDVANDFEKLIYDSDSIFFQKFDMDSVYSATDTSLLLEYASYTALEKGPCVYTSRNMLDLEVHDALGSSSRIGRTTDTKPSVKLEIFPNPAKDYLFIKSYASLNGKQIIVTDVTNRIVLKQAFQPSLNIKALTNGMYFITVTGVEQDYFTTFIKNE